MAKEELQLFGVWSSPFSLRVVWALGLKGLDYEYMEEDLANKSPLLLQYNPVYKKIPVLVHNGNPIAESQVILEYIEDSWKQHPLLPKDPYHRAMARFWIKFADDKLLYSVWNSFITQGKEQDDHRAAAKDNLKTVEEELRGKKFFSGEVVSVVDIFFGSIINLINVLDEITGFKILDGEKFPLLSAWMGNFLTLKIIADALPRRNKMVAMLRSYRGNLFPSTASLNNYVQSE